MRIPLIAAAIAMLTIAPIGGVQSAELFMTVEAVTVAPMSEQELRDTTGQASAIEIGLIAALVSVAAIGAITAQAGPVSIAFFSEALNSAQEAFDVLGK